MTIFRLIAPKWLDEKPSVIEGALDFSVVKHHNNNGYNVYYLPNYPSEYKPGTTVNGSYIDTFEYVFVDCDTKDGIYTKESFVQTLLEKDIPPSRIVDSGNGIHAYWQVTDLDAMSYLRLQKRLIRFYNTDPATSSIYQLLRHPNTFNTKDKDNIVECFELDYKGPVYSCEELDRSLPPITLDDEKACIDHYNRTYNLDRENITISDKMPSKFGKLLQETPEAKELWSSPTDDRSKNDYRLGHLMFANGFTKDEAATVLANSAKALTRAPVHRISYAQNIIDKIWTFEGEPSNEALKLSQSVQDILKKSPTTIKGTPLRCHPFIDNTEHGFRLGQVVGLVAGSGVGKTSLALNMFKWFAEKNPDFHHFFIPLEQPGNEIAYRWQTMCGEDTSLHNKVHVMSNYDDDGNFRHLSFDEIRVYLEQWQKETGNKIGCVVIDHIGALKKKGAKDENQDLVTICHAMKAFAVQTNTLLVMQSQSNRDKAGVGDLELNKDAAYGTVFFESYCDYLITMWQPLKRFHSNPACPTVTAYKFCKIRHKKAKKDVIQEDVPYYLYFDSNTELLRRMTQDEVTSFNWFLPQASKKRSADRKTEILTYQSVPNE